MSAMADRGVIENSKVLMVGAGGIGCELLKTLVLTGFKHIHVIDMDTIEVSNLNRQFLFRKRHVGMSKAQVAREAVLRFRPDVEIVAHHANVKSSQFNVEYFQQFSIVLNGLDNLDARRHVNRLCLAADVPLVESGTTGYLGQVTVHVKGRTECYECQPKPAPKTYPVCTITSTPSKPVHCIVWAKDLPFLKLFGDKTLSNDLDVRTSGAETSNEQEEASFFDLQKDETSKAYAARVFDRLFGQNIEIALKNEGAWKERRKPTPLFIADIFGSEDKHEENGSENGSALENKSKDEGSALSAMTKVGLKNPQEMWSVKENAKLFLESVRLFLDKRKQEIGKLTFDKDDQLAVEFVTAAANLRAHSFGIPMQTLFDAKGIAGNIIHAIATTNAIIAGLIVLEAIKLLEKNLEACRMTYCLEHASRKLLLMPCEMDVPNPKCYVCSQTPLVLEVNTSTVTLRDVVEKIARKKLAASFPTIMQGYNVLCETGDDIDPHSAAIYEAKLDMKLDSLTPVPIVDGVEITIEDLQQDFSCSVYVKHREDFSEEEADEMRLGGLDLLTPADTQATAKTEAALKSSSAEIVDGDEDTVMIDGVSALGTKRKLEEEPQGPVQKKMKV
ncbi:ubiquitin-like 1-activating enzyme E1 B [Marchantia polymorpha subsp. ruderalis]|uniref:SUMO-activating enzyme subunit n=2 Tax=Marchantia polymorpha TaxID=3197 RepID=A0A176WH66_MARPO|nr:hypothetical protein AXG93_3384s1190 [Marchantia polymorpha subsp. ruderalis]PTQ45328.1 hypothetical protein MARPO_0015s0126 [Marchantia polymorpha]BBN01562.1 hypothetical protein Mp_2g08410 [Marchantia polymorpha subsp. ruderalis]|eukprot:PTQ45328.1 hypothetical protein MARPO_0015s0126 [Marchantia polymorpha]